MNNTQFIDDPGLQQLWGKIKLEDGFIGTRAQWNALTASQKAVYDGKRVTITDDGEGSFGQVDLTQDVTGVLPKANGGTGGDPLHNETILTCTTGRSIVAKVVAYPGFELTEGAHIFVRFTSTVTSNPTSGTITLNVNETGAKSIVSSYRNDSTTLNYLNSHLFCNGKVREFIYDGSHWVLINSPCALHNIYSSSKLTESVGNGDLCLVQATVVSETPISILIYIDSNNSGMGYFPFVDHSSTTPYFYYVYVKLSGTTVSTGGTRWTLNSSAQATSSTSISMGVKAVYKLN